MPAQLLALTEGPSIFLDKPILLLGRDMECDIRFESRKISRKHCCIAQVGRYLVVRDLGSTNGVHINGVRVIAGRLKAGDELTIANCRYQVHWDEMAPPRSPKPAPPEPAAPHADVKSPAAEDDMLEMCDEPVPLADSSPSGRSPKLPPVRPMPAPGSGDQAQPEPSPPGQDEFSEFGPEPADLANDLPRPKKQPPTPVP